MITEAILSGFQAVVTILLGLLPSLPSIPDPVIEALDMFVDLIADVVGVISYLYTPTILVLVFTVLIAIINFEVIYKFVLWIYHKVRG